MEELRLTIVHELPGRLRLRLSRPSKDLQKLKEAVGKHEGFINMTYNPVSRSLLIRYRPALVSGTEITVRTAMALSIESANAPIKLYREGREQPLKPLDYYAGLTLMLAALTRTRFLPTMGGTMEYHAAGATTLSVMNHAWQEVKEEGVYHPEVLSSVYLIGSIINGNVLKASVLTWLLTFGRHLLDISGDRLIVQALEVKEIEGKNYIDAVVRPDSSSINNPIAFVVNVMGKSMGIEGQGKGSQLMDSITIMSREHGNVLEGLSAGNERVYMRLNQ